MSKLPEYARLVRLDDRPGNERLRAFHKWWREQSGSPGVLTLTSLDDLVVVAPEVSPDAFMVDVQAPDNEFLLKFVGNRLEAFIGNRTGNDVRVPSDHPEFHAKTMEVMQAVLETRAAIHAGPIRASIKWREHMTMESINVPVSLGGERVDRVIGAIVFEAAEATVAGGKPSSCH